MYMSLRSSPWWTDDNSLNSHPAQKLSALHKKGDFRGTFCAKPGRLHPFNNDFCERRGGVHVSVNLVMAIDNACGADYSLLLLSFFLIASAQDSQSASPNKPGSARIFGTVAYSDGHRPARNATIVAEPSLQLRTLPRAVRRRSKDSVT